MSNLGPQRINQSFGDLLQLPNGLTPAIQNVQDGSGNVTPLEISTTAVDFPISAPIGLPGMFSDIATSTGSDYIGFQQVSTGSTLRSEQGKLSESISVLDFSGVDPTGVSNSNAGLQAAITATRFQGGLSKKLLWTAGTYLITVQLTLGTNQYIEFEPGVTINFVAPDPLNTTLFVASNQSEVYLNGNGATINGTRGSVAGQGSGTAFLLYGSDNVTIRNFLINDFATDGITIWGDSTGSGACRNVLIENCVVNNCRRNGMSIISAQGCTVIGGEYNGTNGSLGGPWAGIDIEPNSDCFIEDVVLIGVKTIGNAGAGIQITPGAMSANTNKRYHVNILGGRSLNDGDTTGVAGLYFVNGGALVNKIYGEIVVRGYSVDQPKSRGISFREWDADLSPRAILEDITVYNPDSTSAASTNVNRTGIVIYADSSQTTTNLGNIELRNCLAEDLRSTPRMTWGMITVSDAGKTVKNVFIENPTSINTVDANKFDVYTATSEGPGSSILTDVVYSTPKPVSIGGNQSIAGFGGKRINVTASINLTLPFASTCSGMSYEIQTAPGVNSVTLVLQTGDMIAGFIDVVSTNLVLDDGAYVKLRSQGDTTWYAEILSGNYRIAGTSMIRKIQWGTAAPVSGTWAQGDRIFNATPSVGQPKSWVCTVGGTPGTWVSEGNL